MAESTRSLVYRLKADITEFSSRMAVASKSMDNAADKAEAAEKKTAKYNKALRDVGNAAGKVGLAAAAGIGAAVVASANFDEAMAHVQAATMESATAMESLRAAALKAGADTAFSATEAAAAIENLAKAGISTRDILGGGLDGALSLAAAGTIDVGQAAEIAATAMTQFKLAGTQVPHIADALAAGAGKAQGEVTDLAQALAQVGLVANQSGQGLEQTVGTLSAFASAGLLGSDSGTSLKTFLLQLVPATTAAAKAMEGYGLIAFDANEANKTLAKDGIHAASNSIDDVTRAVARYLVNQGVANAGTAKLAKATQEYMMKMGLLRSEFTKANGDFKDLSDIAGVLRDKLDGLSESDRQAALKKIFGQDAVRAATVLYDEGAKGIDNWTKKVDDSGYAAKTAATKMNSLKGDLEKLKGSLETALIGTGSGSQGPLRSATQGLEDLVNKYNGLPPAAQSATLAIGAFVAASGGSLFVFSRTVTGLSAMRTALIELGIVAESTTAKTLAVRGAAFGLGGAVAGVSLMANESTKTGKAVETLGLAASGALLGFSVGGPIGAAVGAGAGALTGLAKATIFADKQVKKHGKDLTDYTDTLNQTTGAVTRLTRQRVLDDLQSKGLIDQARRSGIAASDLIDAALGNEKAFRKINKQFERTLSVTDALTGSDLKKWLRDTSFALGLQQQKVRENTAAISGYDKKLASLPRNQVTKLGLTGYEAAMLKVGSLGAALLKLDGKVFKATIAVTTQKPQGSNSLTELLGGARHATGGYISGPGTATSDSIPAWLSNGEYVIKAAAVRKYGLQMMHQMNSMRFAQGGYVGAGGGSVNFPASMQADFSERGLALLAQLIKHSQGPTFPGATFYGDGKAERAARLHNAMGGS